MNQKAKVQVKKTPKHKMEAQEKLAQHIYSGTAGRGMECVRMKGTHDMVSVTIYPDAIESKEDIQL